MSPRRLHPGGIYEHPEDGPIRIESGNYEVNGRLSNFWHWTVLETGEQKHGYGGPWEDLTDQYITVSVPKSEAGQILELVPAASAAL